MCWSLLLNLLFTLIDGRNEPELYQIHIPATWERVEITPSQDTKLPLAEFKSGNVRLVIHNFPGMAIPPKAQVERWKKQFSANAYTTVQNQSFSGFQGLVFDGGEVLAWALELGHSHRGEAAAPVTLKFTGPESEIDQKKQEIIQAARSFELHEDL